MNESIRRADVSFKDFDLERSEFGTSHFSISIEGSQWESGLAVFFCCELNGLILLR